MKEKYSDLFIYMIIVFLLISIASSFSFLIYILFAFLSFLIVFPLIVKIYYNKLKINLSIYLGLIAVFFLVIIILFLGLSLFIIPGIYLFAKLIFSGQEYLIKKKGIYESLKSSFSYSSGNLFYQALMISIFLLFLFFLYSISYYTNLIISLIIIIVYSVGVVLSIAYLTEIFLNYNRKNGRKSKKSSKG
ncbi:MAG: hypothetical protein OH340_01585 [Candidatus Parvarchaeota archaeon]|nr:hypothetical protein [Candidatus Rehaiarchaeum fermentans]